MGRLSRRNIAQSSKRDRLTHNTFGLRSIEKTVLEGPLTVIPKPLWSPLHRHAEPIAWNLFNLYHQPSLRHVAELTYSAFASIFK